MACLTILKETERDIHDISVEIEKLIQQGRKRVIKEMMVNKKILVDDALECLLMPSDPAHDSLYASMQYSLMAGGKRIRPVYFWYF